MIFMRASGALLLATAVFLSAAHANADQAVPSATGAISRADTAGAVAGTDVPPDYVIGPGDVLIINFWRRADVSGEVTVRPDGRISLPLLDDIDAAGLTPEQLRDRVIAKASKLFEDARPTFVVREVNSRIVYITGLVAKPGPYPLRGPLTVMQLISLAGGLREFADAEKIAIVRRVNGKEVGLRFNYKDVSALKKLEQNIELKPGDTVVVP